MMTACFDAAGKKEDKSTPVIVVAGFSSIAGVWREFDRHWLSILKKHHLSYFHAGDFAHSVRAFSRWKGDEPRRRLLVSDLLDVIQEYGLRKFGAIIKKKDFVKARQKMNLSSDPFVDPYVLCARSAVDDFVAFSLGEGIDRNLKCVFDKGDSEDLLRKHFKRHDLPAPDFYWSKEHVTRKGIKYDPFIGLQAAGWLTWEYYVDSSRIFGLSGKDPSNRVPFSVFENCPGYLKIPYASELGIDVRNQISASFSNSLKVVQESTTRLGAAKREPKRK